MEPPPHAMPYKFWADLVLIEVRQILHGLHSPAHQLQYQHMATCTHGCLPEIARKRDQPEPPARDPTGQGLDWKPTLPMLRTSAPGLHCAMPASMQALVISHSRLASELTSPT